MNNIFFNNNFLNLVKIGFEFEFYSNLKRKKIANSLSKILRKKILVFDDYHSNFKPTKDIFKLERDYSGGSKMVELITGPLYYFESIPILIKILKWIEENGYTDKKCAFQFGISIDDSNYINIPSFKHLNILKFILGFDENFIYKRFPERKDLLYAKSIKKIIPLNKFVDFSTLTTIDENLFKVPLDKNMGINFLKLSEGYLEVRYIGGSDYQKKYSSIKEIIDYIINYTIETLQSNKEYSNNDFRILKELLNDVYKNASAFNNYQTFQKKYSNIILMINLKSELETIKTHFLNIRDELYYLIINNNITEGIINYDSDIGKFQLKNIKTNKAYNLENCDIIESEISGILSNCRIFLSKINNSKLENCIIVSGNEIQNSKIINSEIMYNNILKDCYIDNKLKEINGEIDGGIIRSGNIGELAFLSEKTEIIKKPRSNTSKK